MLRVRGTLFWPKVAREATKMNETRTIRSEIARGIVSNRSRGPEMDKMVVFSIFSAIEMALQAPVTELRIWGETPCVENARTTQASCLKHPPQVPFDPQKDPDAFWNTFSQFWT